MAETTRVDLPFEIWVAGSGPWFKRVRYEGGKPGIQKFASPDKTGVFALAHDEEAIFVLGASTLSRYPRVHGWIEKPSASRELSDSVHYDVCVARPKEGRFAVVGVKTGLEILDAVSLARAETFPWDAGILRVRALPDGCVACADALGRRFRIELATKKVDEYPVVPEETAPAAGGLVVDEQGDVVVATAGGWILWYTAPRVPPAAVRVTEGGLRGLAADRTWAWAGQGKDVIGLRDRGRGRVLLEAGGGRILAVAREGNRLVSLDDRGLVSVFQIPPDENSGKPGRPIVQMRTDMTEGYCLLLAPRKVGPW